MNFTLNKKQQPMHLTEHGICARGEITGGSSRISRANFSKRRVRHAEENSISSTLDVEKLLIQLPSLVTLTFMMVVGPRACSCMRLPRWVGGWLRACVRVCVCVFASYLFGCNFGSRPYYAMHTKTCRSGPGIKVRPGKKHNVGTLARPDFLLSLATRGGTCPPRLQAGVTHQALLREPRSGSLGIAGFFFFPHTLFIYFEETTWSFGTDERPTLTSNSHNAT